jgi:hypothetical protein
MSGLRNLLEEYEGLLRASGSPEPDTMVPGLEPGRIRDVLNAAGLAAPDEIVDWFSWCNGEARLEQDGFGSFTLAPTSLAPVSLEASLQHYRREELEEAHSNAGDWDDPPQNDPEYWWPSSWVVIARMNQHLLVADTNSPDGTRCPVSEVTWQEAVPFGTSIEAVVAYWIASLRAGSATWDDQAGRWIPEPSSSPRWPAPEPGIPPPVVGVPP